MSKPLLKLSMEELLKELRLNPALRKNSSARLAQMYSLSLTEVETARAILKSPSVEDVFDRELIDNRLEELSYNHIDAVAERHGVNLDTHSVRLFWSKDTEKGMKHSLLVGNKPPEPLTLDGIKEVLLSEIEPYTWKEPEVVERTLLIYCADMHIGLRNKQDQLIQSQYYDEFVFRERLFKTLELVKNVDEVILVALGDAVDSGLNEQTSRGGHSLPSNMDSKQMYHVYIDTFKAYFAALVEKNIKIRFVSVSEGNHEAELSHIYASSLELYLNVKWPQIETKVFNRYIDYITVQDRTFIFTHGKDRIENKRGLPLILDAKTEAYFVKFMVDNGITPDRKVSVVKGDLHQYSEQQGELFRYKNCLAMCSSSNWSQLNFMSKISGISTEILEGDLIHATNLFF